MPPQPPNGVGKRRPQAMLALTEAGGLSPVIAHGGIASDSLRHSHEELEIVGNRNLATWEVDTLVNDDFLLGRSQSPVGARIDLATRWSTIDEALGIVDDALRDRDVSTAELIWRQAASALTDAPPARLATVLAAETVPPVDAAVEGVTVSGGDSKRHLARHAAKVLCKHAADALEAALYRGDRFHARREHQRLYDLIACSRRLTGSTPEDMTARLPDLEARFREHCNDASPFICSLFPDIWCLFCFDKQYGAAGAVQAHTSRPHRLQ